MNNKKINRLKKQKTDIISAAKSHEGSKKYLRDYNKIVEIDRQIKELSK